MDINRLQTEKIEAKFLSPYGTRSKDTRGREEPEAPCSLRTDFQRDRDRIIHSKSFRRLKHKTQVFIAPEGDHYRTRLTHTLEVAQISRTLARALRLNEDLVEAIALGHDLGHTPFGHTGEKVLNQLNPKGFRHNEQSLKVVEYLEHNENRIGLNLTYEVKDGILNHTGESQAKTLEGQLVRIADRIAYINHDIDDAIRGKIINESQIPESCIRILGKSHGERINNMIVDIIENSFGKEHIAMSEEMEYYTDKLRDFMFDRVYLNSLAKQEEDKAIYIIEQIFGYYLKNLDKLPREHIVLYENREWNEEDIISDYIAGMTDRFVMNLFKSLFIPKAWERL